MNITFCRLAAWLITITVGLTFSLAPAAAAQYIINGIYANSDPAADDDVKLLEPHDSRYQKFTDQANGYSLLVPADMTVDAALSPVVTILCNQTIRLEIYYDNFAGSKTTTDEYISYGNKFVTNTRDHTVLTDETYNYHDFTVHLLKWTRRSLAHVPDDKNYYVSAEIIKNTNEVYTLFIKSSQPIEDEKAIINSFNLVACQGVPRFSLPSRQPHTPLNAETREFYHKYFDVTSPLRWGIFEPGAPQSFEKLDVLENQLAYTFPVLVRYQTLDENVPVSGLENAYERGRYVELTLQTQRDFADNASTIYDILDGKYDDYFAVYAAQLKAFGHPVLFRFNNEMNGEWCWYSAYHYSKDPELYKALWRYVRNVFDENGVDNVLWVWNPHDLSFPNFKWNHYLMYYPGDEYVDIIGLTGYNTGTYFAGERWREFNAIYPGLYAEYDQHFAKPFMITEFGANSVGGDKAAWLVSMFKQIGQLNKIKLAIWWNGIDYDPAGNPGRIYLLDDTDETTAAFRQGLKKFPQ